MTSQPDAGSQEVPRLAFPLQAGETVLQIARRHWWFLWPNILLKALALLAPLIAVWWLLDTVGAYEGIGKQAYWLVSLLWAVYWAARMFLTWYRYQHDVWVITNQRIVDVFKKHPFDLRVNSADLINVQDISIERSGILQTVLDFGDIVCQTAGARDVFRLGGLPNPRRTQALIDQERDRERLRVRGI